MNNINSVRKLHIDEHLQGFMRLATAELDQTVLSEKVPVIPGPIHFVKESY